MYRLTHNSGPLHRVIRAGAARRSTNASLMPRRTNCKRTTRHDEREGEAVVGGDTHRKREGQIEGGRRDVEGRCEDDIEDR